LCYRYTIPQWIVKQFQNVNELLGNRAAPMIAGIGARSFYPLAPALGKPGELRFWLKREGPHLPRPSHKRFAAPAWKTERSSLRQYRRAHRPTI
jgi:hypothetical protein